MPLLRTPMDFAALVKATRLSLGENQAQFAKRINKTQAWVSHFEKGEFKNVSLGILLDVMLTLDIPLSADLPGAKREATSVPDEEGDLALDFDDDQQGFAP